MHLVDLVPSVISTAQPGTTLDGVFLVTEFEERKTGKGDPFWTLSVRDATGAVQCAPVWSNNAALVAGVSKGSLVRASGVVGLYKGTDRQFELATLQVEDDPARALTLLPRVQESIEGLWSALDGYRNNVVDARLRGVLNLFYEDPDFREQFQQWPAAVTGHHAAVGGLLLHVYEVTAMACRNAKVMRANVDLVVTGAMLHDIGKLRTYTVGPDGFGYTARQLLTGHIVEGVLLLKERLETHKYASDWVLTETQELELVHGILSHHQRLEYGSPVQPATLEAELVCWADEASAKGASMREELADDSLFAAGPVATKRSWQLNRKLWRSTSAWGVHDSGS